MFSFLSGNTDGFKVVFRFNRVWYSLPGTYKCRTSFCQDFRVLLCLLSSTEMPPSKTFARECRETNCKVLPAWKNQDFTHCPQFLGIWRANFVLDIFLLGIKNGNRHLLGFFFRQNPGSSQHRVVVLINKLIKHSFVIIKNHVSRSFIRLR